LERATELVSHAVPRGELPKVIERALDALIEREMRRRIGTGKPRKQRPLKPGSRHVPREVARLVWERDSGRASSSTPRDGAPTSGAISRSSIAIRSHSA